MKYLQVGVGSSLLQLRIDDFLRFLPSSLLHHALTQHGQLGQGRRQLLGGEGLTCSVLDASVRVICRDLLI